MNAEESKQQDVKLASEPRAQQPSGETLAYGKIPVRTLEGTQQPEFACREQAYLSTPIVTTGGSDHSQQENFILSTEHRHDAFFDDFGLSAARQHGWSKPSQHMRSPGPETGIHRKAADPLSPVSTHSSNPGSRAGRPPKFEARQDGDLQQPPNGLSRQGQYSKHSYAPRQPYGLALHDNGIEGKYGREDLGPRGMSEELMGGLYPAEEQHAGSTAGRDPRHKAGHRIFDDAGLGMTPEEMPGGMPRGFAHDDELLYLSGYGGQDAYNRLPMQSSPHSDYRGERHVPSPAFLSRGNPRARSGGQLSNQAIEEPVYSRMSSGEGRDGMYPRMGALHMNRSASDGLIRNHPSGQGYEASMHSTENISGEHRARSASGMQEEISYRAGSGQDQQQGVLATRMNETPDFAMIYAFLGSMFDPVCHMIDHADVMNQMNPVDRETTNLILANCAHNLSIPEFAEHILYHSLRQASYSSRPRAPLTGTQGYAPGGAHRHGPLHH